MSTILTECALQNYNKKSVMERALPIAVKFLQKGNKELSKNLASYLSLAAIEYSYLLGPHILQILDSISDNHSLCQILPQIYEVSSAVLDKKVVLLVPLLRTCEVQEKLALLQLFTMIMKKSPLVSGILCAFYGNNMIMLSLLSLLSSPLRAAFPKYVIHCRLQRPAPARSRPVR